VDNDVCFELLVLSTAASMDHQGAFGLLDGGDLGGKVDCHAELAGEFDELPDQVGVERFEGPLSAVQDRDLGAGAGGDVSELEGDITAADERHPGRQLVEFHEGGARGQVLLAGDAEGGVARAAGDHHLTAGDGLIPDGEGCRANELGASVQRSYPSLSKAVLHIGRDVLDDDPLEGDHVGPDKRGGRRGNARPLHPASGVDRLGHPDQDLLGVTAAERAGPPEGSRVDRGDAPSGGSHAVDETLRCLPGAHDDQVDVHRAPSPIGTRNPAPPSQGRRHRVSGVAAANSISWAGPARTNDRAAPKSAPME
jgi:hypothetical protein